MEDIRCLAPCSSGHKDTNQFAFLLHFGIFLWLLLALLPGFTVALSRGYIEKSYPDWKLNLVLNYVFFFNRKYITEFCFLRKLNADNYLCYNFYLF